jgi:tRNA G18 (ribose-2'-O)-methylase SpoU
LTTEETQRLWLRLEAEHQTQLEIVQDQPSIQLITGVQDVINLGAMRT